jgi:chromate transporter
VKAFVDGITAAVVGALVGAVVVIGMRSISDLPQLGIALAALAALLYWKKLREPAVIAIAATVGLLIKALN